MSAPQTITIANTHATASFEVDGFSNGNPARFPFVAGGSCAAPPFTLAAGASCTVRIAFLPDSVGSFSAGFFVTSTTPATTFAPTAVSLSGTGTPVPGVLAPDALAFGEVPSFATSAAMAVSVGNAATTATLTIATLTTTNPSRFFFVPGGTCPMLPFPLAAGASCTVRIAFRPDAVGGYAGSFSVGSTTPQASFTPTSVSLSGTGGPDRVFSDGYEAP